MIENLEDLARQIWERAAQARLAIHGPAATDLGYGGAPIVTLWSGDRRAHFYFAGIEGTVSVLLEVAERGGRTRPRVTKVRDLEDAWRILEPFFRGRRSLEELAVPEEFDDAPAQDALIPHPPDQSLPRVQVSTQVVGTVTRQEPAAPEARTAAAPTRTEAAPTVEAVAGVILFSKDPPRLARWYSEKLGIFLRSEGESFSADLGGTHFGIYAGQDPGGPRAMPALRVGGFDAMVESLALKGVEVEALDRSARGRFAYVRDADGNPVELWDGGD